MNKIFKWIFYSNQYLIFLLLMCITFAVTTTFENSILMGILIFISLLFSSFIMNLLKNNKYKIIIYSLIITIFISIISILLYNYVLPLYNTFGIYLPLIIVNYIALVIIFPDTSKNGLIWNIKDTIHIGIQYTVILFIIGLIREIIGNNTITLMNNISNITGYKAVYEILPSNYLLPNEVFIISGGSFIILGIIIGILNKIRDEVDINE